MIQHLVVQDCSVNIMDKPALLVLCFFFCYIVSGLAILPEATPPSSQTLGQPWPMPQSYKSTEETQLLYKYNFQFNVVGQDCDDLRDAINRYFKIIFYTQGDSFKFRTLRNRIEQQNDNVLLGLDINLSKACDRYPSLNMDESCEY